MISPRTILLLALLPISTATARLGETLDQCRTRYGKESFEDLRNQLRIFNKGDLIIAIVFLEGKAASVTYLNSAAGPNRAPAGQLQPAAQRPPLTQDQIQHLLSVNRGGDRKWGNGKKAGKHILWRTSDSDRTAVHDPALHSLTIQSRAFVEEQERIIATRKKAAESKTPPSQ